MKRYLEDAILKDALPAKKIAFITGPRQVGKTSLAQALIHGSKAYFSWDDPEFKKLWVKNPKLIFADQDRVVLDEIHKDRTWKNKLKGLYDLYGKKTELIVTGSARLDFYPKSGDSLQGRYFPYRLHPLSLNETPRLVSPPEGVWDGDLKSEFELKDLLSLGGFPEPFLGQSVEKARRWRRLYRERLIREDLREITDLKETEKVGILSQLLEDTVSGGLSYQSLREDLGVSFDTIKNWVQTLEGLFFCFRIKPWSRGVKRSLLKEPKLYLYDWSILDVDGPRFENLIASHLLKSCQAWSDLAHGDFDLFYLKDKQKREVDFLVTKNKKPWLLVEAKVQSTEVSRDLIYFTEILRPEFAIQVVQNPRHERKEIVGSPIQVMDVRRFLSRLV